MKNEKAELSESPSSFVLRQFVHGPFDDFAEAIEAARALAEPGDVVLLSPGCASFGMFRNEFHRGEEFRRSSINCRLSDIGFWIAKSSKSKI